METLILLQELWTGEKAYKIQAHSNDLYIQYTEDIYFRNASGNDRCQMDASGNFYAEGNITSLCKCV